MLKKRSILNYLLILIFGIFVSSCGYKIIGLGNEKPVRIYVDTVKNNSIHIEAGDIVQEEVELFLLKYGILSNEKNATYYTDIIIEDISMEDSILSDTEEATSANAILKLSITLIDSEENEIFTWNGSLSKTFTITSSIQTTIVNKDNAIKDSLNESLEEFRAKLNKELYK